MFAEHEESVFKHFNHLTEIYAPAPRSARSDVRKAFDGLHFFYSLASSQM
jgi:hypothetical protein